MCRAMSLHLRGDMVGQAKIHSDDLQHGHKHSILVFRESSIHSQYENPILVWMVASHVHYLFAVYIEVGSIVPTSSQ